MKDERRGIMLPMNLETLVLRLIDFGSVSNTILSYIVLSTLFPSSIQSFEVLYRLRSFG